MKIPQVVRFLGLGCLASVAAMAASNVTFNKDVLSVLQKNCQECHRTGEVAPMSLMSYAEARPWAKAIAAAVSQGKMPPWFADPRFGAFANDPRLTDAERSVVEQYQRAACIAPKRSR